MSSKNNYAIGFENGVEQRTPVDLEIMGTIPSWLNGELWRTGPGTYRIPHANDPSKKVEIQHWFDGLSITHRFVIYPGGQRVTYNSRKGSEDLEKRIAEEGAYRDVTFAQQLDPCEKIFKKFFTMFSQPWSASTKSSLNVQVTLTPDMPGWQNTKVKLPQRATGPHYLVAKTDADQLQVLEADTLEPVATAAYKDLDPRLDGQLCAAHSCRDKETGEFFNYSMKLGGRHPTYKVFRIASDGKVDILAEIKDAPAAYMHSFTMTQKYVILTVWQAHITKFGLSILYNKNIAQSIEKKWNPNYKTTMYVIDRVNGGVVTTYKTPAFYCFHHVNAYDDPSGKDDVIIDMSVYETHSVIDLFYLDHLRHLDQHPMLMGRARRFRLKDIHAKAPKTREAEVVFTLPQTQSIELPTIKPELYHKPHRYAYGINQLTSDSFADNIIKIDFDNPEADHKVWGVPGYTPSEPIFVSRPGATEEDDGVILSVVLDGERSRSMLAIIDARSMQEIARAEMKHAHVIGFHGLFSMNK